MDHTQRKSLYLLAGLLLIYFLLFIPANLTGAKDPVMISIFEPDEFAQYSIPRDMLTPQDTIKHTIYNFIAYDHYYYGFPFYLSSIAGALPVILSNGLTNKNSQITLLLFRQFVSVLPMCLATGLLVFSVTRYRKQVLSLALAVYILSIPAVVENNLWWHPDSLVVLFIIGTLAALLEDRLRLGKFFWLAAITCGMAVGTKVLGFFFFLTIPLYLCLAYFQKHYPLRRLLLAAFGFLGLMFATILISNPYLLIPSEFNQMLQIMTRQSAAQSAGWTLTYARGPSSWLPIITHLYGSIPFWIACLVCLAYTIVNKSTRNYGLILLSWITPLSIYILFFTAIKPTHFLLPVAIPLIAILVQPYLNHFQGQNESETNTQKKWRAFLQFALASILIVQFGQNLVTDIHIYREKLNREQANPVIAFYQEFTNLYGEQLNQVEKISVLRDVRAYFPASGQIRVSEFYNTLTEAQLKKKNPDLLILWNQRIRDYGSSQSSTKAIDQESYQEIQRFFRNASTNQIPGYQLLYDNGVVSAFVQVEFREQHSLHPVP